MIQEPMHYAFDEGLDVFVDESGQYPTHHPHDDQDGRAQHIKHNEKYVNAEIHYVVCCHGTTPSLLYGWFGLIHYVPLFFPLCKIFDLEKHGGKASFDPVPVTLQHTLSP